MAVNLNFFFLTFVKVFGRPGIYKRISIYKRHSKGPLCIKGLQKFIYLKQIIRKPQKAFKIPSICRNIRKLFSRGEPQKVFYLYLHKVQYIQETFRRTVICIRLSDGLYKSFTSNKCRRPSDGLLFMGDLKQASYLYNTSKRSFIYRKPLKSILSIGDLR